MKKKNRQGKPQKNIVVKNLSVYAKEIEKLDKQYSKLSDEVKSLKRDKYSNIIFRILFQVLRSDMIHYSLKEETENFIEWAKIILSKFQ